MKTVRRATMIERAHQRTPARAVGIDAPESPQNVAAQSLRFERAEHDASVREHDRMQGARDVEMADLLDVLSQTIVRVIHHEKLQCDGGITFRWLESIAVAGENNSSAGQRTCTHVEHSIVVMSAVRLRRSEIVRPFR